MSLYLASLAPYFDLIYSHLPTGSLFGFLFTLPDASSIASLLISLPDGNGIVQALGNIGVTG